MRKNEPISKKKWSIPLKIMVSLLATGSIIGIFNIHEIFPKVLYSGERFFSLLNCSSHEGKKKHFKELALCTAALLPELQPAPCFLSAIIVQID